MTPQHTPVTPDPPYLRELVAIAEAEVERIENKTYRMEIGRVLHRVLLPFLRQRSERDLPTGPLPLTHRERIQLQEEACHGRSYTRWGHHRLAALDWLLGLLSKREVLRVPPYQYTLKSLRDVVIQPTRQMFDDEERIGRELMSALRAFVLRTSIEADPEGVEIALASLLIFNGSLISPNAFRVVAGLHLDECLERPGWLILHLERAGGRPGRAHGAQRRERQSCPPQRLPLGPPEQALVNAYLSGGALTGRLNLGNGSTPLFPGLAALLPSKRALPRAFRECWVHHAPGLVGLSLRRFLEAAQYHAVYRMAPICAAVLTGRLDTTPAVDADLDELEAPVGTPVTCRGGAPAGGADAEDRRVRRAVRSALRARAGPTRAAILWTPEHDRVYRQGREGLADVLRALRAETAIAETLQRAQAITAGYEQALLGLGDAIPARLENWRYVLRLAVDGLSAKKVVPNTVLARLDEAELIVCGVVGDRAFAELDAKGWLDTALEAMDCGERAASRKQTRYRVEVLHAYLRRVLPSGSVPAMAWASQRELWVAAERIAVETLFPWDIDAVRDDVHRRVAPDLAEILDIFIVLGSGAGLRAGEAATLPLRQVHTRGGELLVEILRWQTKTDAGERNIPLHWLLPEPDLQALRTFLAARRTYGLAPDAPLLATPAFPDGFDAEWLAGVVTRSIKRVTGKELSDHDLRHYFVTHFPLRHFVATRGRTAARSLGERLLATPAYALEALDRFAQLFGFPSADEATRIALAMRRTTQPFHQLIDYVGHASPSTTVRSYSHLLDVLQRLYADLPLYTAAPPVFTRQEAALALHRGDRTIRNLFPTIVASGVVDGRALLVAQQAQLNRLRQAGGRDTVEATE